jgi:Flp pilus assembly pilin Flp
MKKFLIKCIKNQKGATGVIETILLSGVAIALVLVLFFPSIKTFMEGAIGDLESWYATESAVMFE